MGLSLEQRFWDKVEQSLINDCLNWVGAKNKKIQYRLKKKGG